MAEKERESGPLVIPKLRRYQFFTNLEDRMLTAGLNSVAMMGIVVALTAVVTRAAVQDSGYSIFCYECRACYGTKEHCPAGITQQAELTVSSRVDDYRRFILNGGMKCLRAGGCVSFCVLHLDLPRLYGAMQQRTLKALREGRIDRELAREAMEKGQVGMEFIDDFTGIIRKGATGA